MKPEKSDKLHDAFEGFLKRTFQQVPLDGIEDFIHENIVGFGTTAGEEVYSADEFIDYIKRQEEQGKGLEFNFDREPVHELVMDEEDLALIAEKMQVSIKTQAGEELHIRFLMSTVLTWSRDHWKVVHWHGSVPSDTENDVWHVNEWKAEKEKLEKKVAEQTADLAQKNRELEIEAATERIRTRVTGMQESSDLLDIVVTMRNEFIGLGHDAHYFWHMRWLPDTYEKAMTSGDGSRIGMVMSLPRHMHGDIPLLAEWEKSDEPTAVYAMDAESAVRYVDKMVRLGDFSQIDPNAPAPDDIRDIGGLTFIMARTTHGEIGFSLPGKVEHPPPDSIETLKRFAGVFDLAYRRFEDLKKAELQSRESEIELALERVRSRTMAMHKSEELADVAFVLFEQLRNLGGKLWGTGFGLCSEEKDADTFWFANKNGIFPPVSIPNDTDPAHKQMYEGWKNSTDFLSIAASKEELNKHYEYMMSLDSVRPFFQKILDEGLSFPDWQQWNAAYFDHGYLLIISLEPYPNPDILKRFAKVFDQTYTRFLDLKKVEHQAYESKVEAGLERVRSQAAAMNHSDDLKQIAESMFKELEILDIDPLRYGVGLIRNNKREAELWASTVNDGHYLDQVGVISLSWHPMLMDAHKAWESQHEELVYELSGIELVEYYKKVTEMNPHIQDVEKLTDPNSGITQFCSFLPFEHGVLYAFTHTQPSEDGLSVLKRFAHAFEQAYTRFEDLRVQERQARLIREERDRLHKTLTELRNTQDQLVQQEKLASLGQLTAGIAHEIKNPLNFVNNFSDLSIELVDEVRDELQAVTAIHELRPQEMKDIKDILSDIKANLQKIHEHGTRADSIVKSMLQHSRGGTGKMEPTAINELIKEFVNLAFHGMRAGKNSFNVEIDFNLDESVGDVPLIAEDFSRVILNLCNNAFDALREKQNSEYNIQNAGDYKPKLSVRTHRSGSGNVTIEIEDNGPGIPEEMKDKIMQPFFTTKKGTEGTGLGLSITNDIVKAHGGSIEIRSKRGQFTCFRVYLTKMG